MLKPCCTAKCILCILSSYQISKYVEKTKMLNCFLQVLTIYNWLPIKIVEITSRQASLLTLTPMTKRLVFQTKIRVSSNFQSSQVSDIRSEAEVALSEKSILNRTSNCKKYFENFRQVLEPKLHFSGSESISAKLKQLHWKIRDYELVSKAY